eukprot:985133-Ditylum_brightwellii.AAC.1
MPLNIWNFWNKIKNAIESTLACSNLYHSYHKLRYKDEKHINSTFKHLIPLEDHRNYDIIHSTYLQLTDVLRTHLIDPNTILVDKAPNMAVSLALEKHNSDGFYVLNTIIWENSPQLGGQGESAQHRVMNYYIIPGVTITEFYVRAVNIKSQLNLLQDNT